MKIFVFIILLFSSACFARNYDVSKDMFATYFKGSYGLNQLNDTVYANASGSQTTFADKVPYTYSGELGLFANFKKFGIRFGVEAIKPKQLASIPGKDASGNILMTLTSDVLIYTPKISLEFSPHVTTGSRFFIAAGVGMAYTSFTNDYHFTSAGTTAYSLVDFVEEGSTSNLTYDASMGFEALFADNAAFLLDAGYRYLNVTGLKHQRNTTTFLGAVTSGAAVKNADGKDRTFNMSGPWVGVGFRFYIGL